jgi:cytochrome c biogenesis protein CcmG, thiol:disulfide interchange protein DsbE
MLRVALVMMIVATGCIGAMQARRAEAESQSVEFSLPKLEGGRLASGDLRGQVVMLDFWATWCVPCRDSLPFYQSLADAHDGAGLRVVAVTVDSDPAQVKQFVAEHRLTFDVLLDPEGSLASRLDLSTMPTLLVLGRDGSVFWQHAGFDTRDKTTIKEHVDAALGK